ncbi:hypothetical protein ACQJBY_016710 [Aegilops geniculata]
MRSKPSFTAIIGELKRLHARRSPCFRSERVLLRVCDALQACGQHARLWLACADEPIYPGSSFTYGAMRAKLDRIMASDYYTTTAIGGSYGAEGVQAQESITISPEAHLVEENLAPEGHKVHKNCIFLVVKIGWAAAFLST